MREHFNQANICLLANIGIEYAVCRIDYLISEDGHFRYTFAPNYSVISLLGKKDFQGIPGLKLELGRATYVRQDVVPSFISERIPPENREDLGEILESVGMTYMEPLEFLIKIGDAYPGDNFYLTPFKAKEKLNLSESIGKANTFGMLKIAMAHIAKGDDLLIGDFEVSDENRKQAHDLLLPFYLKAAKSQRESLESSVKFQPEKKRGRKQVDVDYASFVEMDERVRRKKLTIKEASSRLGISVSTYHRLRKRWQKA